MAKKDEEVYRNGNSKGDWVYLGVLTTKRGIKAAVYGPICEVMLVVILLSMTKERE